MRNEVLINLTPQETRVAVVENGLLQELFIERERRRGLVGNIYKGRVIRVLPGMEAAFVDIGFERSAFLHVSEIPAARAQSVGGKFLNIQNYLKADQEIIVQVRKDALGTKGPRLSMRIAVASRYLVLLTEDRPQDSRIKPVQSSSASVNHNQQASTQDPAQITYRPVNVAHVSHINQLNPAMSPNPDDPATTAADVYTATNGLSPLNMAGQAPVYDGSVSQAEARMNQSNVIPLAQVQEPSETHAQSHAEQPNAQQPNTAEQRGHTNGGTRHATAHPVVQESNGVSTKIESYEERQRLNHLVSSFQAEIGGSYIIRTAAEGADPWALRADMQYLQRLWDDIQDRIDEIEVGKIIYSELPLEIRILRDIVEDNTDKVRIDSYEGFDRIRAFAQRFLPQLFTKLEHYPGQRPIFDLYGIEDEIDKALGAKVPLKSGGYLIIEQTEAMITIDVNTGGFVGKSNLEETIFKTNLEATEAIARQLKVRNLGGIIILDFIDMINTHNKDKIISSLKAHLENDSAKYHVGDMSALGLVEMTRKRTRESLGHILMEACPLCSGIGQIKSAETICFEIFREIIREHRQFKDIGGFLVLASDSVVNMCTDEYPDYLAELEVFIDKPIRFQSEPMYEQSQYDVILMSPEQQDRQQHDKPEADNYGGLQHEDNLSQDDSWLLDPNK